MLASDEAMLTLSCTLAPVNCPLRRASLTAEFGSICCNQSAVAMRLGARLASTKLALLSRSSATSRTMYSEYLFWAQFLSSQTPMCKRVVKLEPVTGLYALLTTDMGRFCRNALMSALFICKPPL